ncbi:MAG: AEC family transporter [Pseudomonadota bacterium]
MAPIALAIAPIFLLICTGFGLRRAGFPSDSFWVQNDRLVFYVLMPALFFIRIAEADLSDPGLVPYGATLFAGFIAATLAGMAAARALNQGGATSTSVIQGSNRFNTFIALALAEALYGPAGLQMAVLGAVLLLPFVNLTCVGLFTIYVPKDGTRRLPHALVTLATNPLLLAILAGIAVNLAGLPMPSAIRETLNLLGQAALPIMLLSVGASLKLKGLRTEIAPILAASTVKLAIYPAAILATALALDLPPLAAQTALIYGALPTGVAAYTLARQMGGDGPLMAALITIQTLLSFALIPLWLSLGAHLLSP